MLIDFLLKTVQFLSVVVGGIWMYFRFQKENSSQPRLELEVDYHLHTQQNQQFMTSFNIRIHNKGANEHHLSSISLRLLGLPRDTAFQINTKLANRVDFPIKILEIHNILHENFVVRASVQQSILYHTLIPSHIRFISLRLILHLSDVEQSQEIEKIFELK